MATELDLNIDEGSQYSKKIRVLNQNDSNYDLTGHTARMQLREHAESATVDLELPSVLGSLVISTIDSTIEIIISHEVQLNYKKYVYDLELTDQNGITKRVLQGSVFVSPNVTK